MNVPDIIRSFDKIKERVSVLKIKPEFYGTSLTSSGAECLNRLIK